MQVKPPFSQNKPPTLHQKCSSNLCKMIPKWSQKRSRSGPETLPKKHSKISQKSTKSLQKSTKRLPTMTQKRTLKLQKTVWVVSFPSQKNDDNLEAVFSRFLSSPGGPRPWKSSQNAIKVCKNEGPTFSRTTYFFVKKHQKWPLQGLPKTNKT